MERPRPSSGQRKMSFNPEAATFSPTPSVVTLNPKEPVRPSSAASHSIPSELYDRLIARQYELQYQPKGTSSNMNKEPTASPTLTASSDHFFSHHLDGRNLAQTGHEQTSTSGGHMQFSQALQMNTMGGMMHAPQYAFHSQVPKPDLYELNTSLGLPGLNMDNATEGSPSQSGLPQPLTDYASFYAHYLGYTNSASSDDTVTGPATTTDSSTPTHEHEQATKVVQPPPGFKGEASRTITVEKPRLGSPFKMEPKLNPTSSAVHQNPHNNPVRFAHHMQHFPGFKRGSPSKKRPRAYTRTKRMDQGPEPSAADIYPDDANWEPSHSIHTLRRPSLREPLVPYSPLKQRVNVNDTISWPTPAEVYTPKPPTPLRTPPRNVVNKISPPTADGINDEKAVLALIDSVPHIGIDTLLHFGVLDVDADERLLTSNQVNGKAYGLKNHGLGLGSLGDDWNPEILPHGQPFGLPPKPDPRWKW